MRHFFTPIAEDPEKEINTTEEKEKIIEEKEEGADPVNTTNDEFDKNTSIENDKNENVTAEDENLICSCPLCCCVCSCIKSISR